MPNRRLLPKATLLCLILGLFVGQTAHAKPEPALPVEAGAGVIALQVDRPPVGGVKVKADRGEIGDVVVRGALVEVAWTGAPGPVVLDLRYKTAGGVRQEEQVRLEVSPGGTAELRSPLRVAPGAIPEPLNLGVGNLRGAASLPGAKVEAAQVQFRPAASTEPRVALVAATAEGDPRRVVFQTYALTTRRSTTFDAPPLGEASLELGGQVIGPFKASPAGKVAFDLELDPQVTSAILMTRSRDGQEERKPVNLPSAAGPVLLLAPLAEQSADPRVPVPLHIAAVDAQGQPWTGAMPSISATGGTLGPLKTTGPGVYTATWTPPAKVGTYTIETRLAGQESVQAISTRPTLPQIELSVEPAILEPQSRDFLVRLQARDANGAWAGKAPSAVVVDGQPLSQVSPPKAGASTFKGRLDADKQAATVLIDPPASGGSTPANLYVWSTPLDAERHLVRIAVEDSAGRGVAGIPLKIAFPGGDVPPDRKSGAGGTAHVIAKGSGLLQVSGGGEQAVVLLQTGALGHPLVYGESAKARLLRWQSASPSIGIGRKPAVVAAPILAATADGSAEVEPTAAAPAERNPPSSPEPARSDLAQSEPAGAKPSVTTRGGNLRAGFDLGLVSWQQESLQDGWKVGPEEATITAGGLLSGQGPGGAGARLRVLAWPGGGSWAIDAGVSWERVQAEGSYRFPSADPEPDEISQELTDLSGWGLRLGGRRAFDLGGPAQAYAVAQFERSPTGLVLWEEGAAEWSPLGLLGLRAGGGLMLSGKRVFLDLQASETLGPWPVSSQAGLNFELALTDNLGLRLMSEVFRRQARWDAGEVIETTESGSFLGFGLSYLR